MSTQNSADIFVPRKISQGGTNNTALTDHCCLIYSSSSNAIIPITAGLTGELLKGNSVAGNPTTPYFTSTFNNIFSFYKNADEEMLLTVSNSNVSAGTNKAELQLLSGSTTTGDPYISCSVYVGGDRSTLVAGVDNSDSDKFCIGSGSYTGGTDYAKPGYNNLWAFLTTGESIKPKQPAFSVTANAAASNVTGDGTVYTVVWDVEYFDQNSDFASNTFTAPVTGKYQFNYVILIYGVASNNTVAYTNLSTSNRDYVINQVNPYPLLRSGYYGLNDSLTVDMDAADTVVTKLCVSGGSKVVDIYTASLATWFNGYLVC